ncbi:hypothetical protein [Bacteroides sp. An322]|uniref:hypothetical protein n=1 Tax=Bacteroides sp. An322 TaxID=1965632 RepID=UPI00130215E2|nr:hypothetical protein [Bacteroides sp. An322]
MRHSSTAEWVYALITRLIVPVALSRSLSASRICGVLTKARLRLTIDASRLATSVYAGALSSMWRAAGVASLMYFTAVVWKLLHAPIVICVMPKDWICFAIMICFLKVILFYL